MEKNILIWLILLLPSYVYAQCNVIGTATPVPFGTFSCVPLPLSPAVGGGGETTITRCFNYTYPGPSQLSYLLVNGLCGPFPLYNTLSFQVYTANCATLVVSGTILPVASNNNLNTLNVGETYVICYTWVPNCPQTDACPLIYSNATLPVELIRFDVESNNNNISIYWSTASQVNTDSFIVVKSYDLNYWSLVGSVEGEGTTSSMNEYVMYDTDMTKGVIYFRLIEKTYDGEYINIDTKGVYNNCGIPFEYGYDIIGRKSNSKVWMFKSNGRYTFIDR
jgi:hypothetical protein